MLRGTGHSEAHDAAYAALSTAYRVMMLHFGDYFWLKLTVFHLPPVLGFSGKFKCLLHVKIRHSMMLVDCGFFLGTAQVG